MALTTEARFAGRWRVARRILAVGGPGGRFDGEATLTPAPDGLLYAERGVLRVGPARLTAERAYLWRCEGPSLVRVTHADGAPFHVFDWAEGVCAVEHLCPPDLYRGRLRFLARDWRVGWRVRGPRKDYASATLYTRP